MKKNLALPLLIFLSLFLLAGGAAAVEIGATAPDFKLPTLDGKQVSLSDYKGQVIVLKLATTWCPTCKQQTQEIQSAGNFLRDHNVRVVEVFLQDSEKMVNEYLKGEKFEMPFVALLDDGRALKAYNVYLIPRVLIIDQDFKVRRDGSLLSDRELIVEIEKFAKK
jgi:peroxiredoxin